MTAAFDALILAGSRKPDDPVARAGGKSCKAFVEVAGRPMVERVVAALRASGRVGRIAVAMSPDAPVAEEAPRLARALASGELTHLDPADTPSGTVLAAYEMQGCDGGLLIATGDHPLLTGSLVAEFLDAAAASESHVAAGLAPLRLFDAAYPGERRTALKFKDDAYGGCNLFALMGPEARNALAFWQRMEDLRKQPWRLAMAIGPVTLARYMAGRLSLADAVETLGRRVGARLQPVILQSAEAPKDVDSVGDLELVRRILGERASPADQRLAK